MLAAFLLGFIHTFVDHVVRRAVTSTMVGVLFMALVLKHTYLGIA